MKLQSIDVEDEDAKAFKQGEKRQEGGVQEDDVMARVKTRKLAVDESQNLDQR